MISREFGEKFAKEWIEAWNSHDLDRVLSHYSEDFTMSSPYIAQIAGVESGSLTGKPAVRAYWAAALQKVPALRFELVQILVGAESVTIYYRGVRGMAAEVFFFGQDHLVHRAAAHYE
jgi:ketosteroid isomerase-like protein